MIQGAPLTSVLMQSQVQLTSFSDIKGRTLWSFSSSTSLSTFEVEGGQ